LTQKKDDKEAGKKADKKAEKKADKEADKEDAKKTDKKDGKKADKEADTISSMGTVSTVSIRRRPISLVSTLKKTRS
jgi:hypothetical protein